MLGTGDAEKAREMARRLAPFWSQVTRREESRAFLDRTLVVSALLNDPDAAAALLRPFTLTRLTPSTGPRLVSLSDRYGIEWCQALFTAGAAKALNGLDLMTCRD